MPMPNPLMLVITGAPGSGKTTIGTRLARELGLPFLSKDLFKETLFDTLGWSDLEQSRKFGGAAMTLLYRCAAALLEARQSVALEANFYPQWDTAPLLQLKEQWLCRFVQVVCEAPGPLLWQRYEARVTSGERHPGHADASRLDEIRDILLREPWPSLPLDSPLLRIDTTDFEAIDYRALVSQLSAHQQSAKIADG
jgi:predicted kinase